MSKKRVFLSYAYQDKERVEQITQKLIANGIDVWQIEKELELGADLKSKIYYTIESSETILVFLSKNYLNSRWAKNELKQFINDSEKRKISIIPVALERIKIPPEFAEYMIIHMANTEKALEKIIYKLKTLPEISFDNFSAIKFEKFIGDLLKEYGYTNIYSQEFGKDQGFDFKAEYRNKTPFGTYKTEHWLIEVKFYKNERFSVNAIKQLLDYKRQLHPADLKLLLITNSILTSVAQEYLRDFQKIENTQIEVIDGLLLKQLVTKRKRLLEKYFKI